MIFMKRMLTLALLVMLIAPIAMTTATAAPKTTATVVEETIDIADGEVTLTVVFESETGGVYNGTVDLWAPADAALTCQGVELQATWNGSIATVDLAAHDLSILDGGTITVTARYPLDGDLEHRMLHNAPVEVTVDSDRYVRSTVPLSFTGGRYTGSASLSEGDVVTVTFASDGSDDDLPGMLHLGVGALVGALAVAAVMFMQRRQRRDRYLEKEPVEALEMRKKLLTQLLKQLEIQRDKGKIADAYYQSIKDYFKEEAVQVMREIDRRS